MTLTNITALDQFRSLALPLGYPTDRRRLFVTQDKVQPAILYTVSQVTKCQALAMYSLDDAGLVSQIITNYHSLPGGLPTLVVQDQSCYATAEGTRIAAPLVALRGQPNFRWSVGTSRLLQIMHLKSFVGDLSFLITGSTNWSNMGENEEDNECQIAISSVEAIELNARIEAIYAWQIQNCNQPPTS